MDPITAILAALVAGASAGLQDTVSSAVKDTFANLKSLIRRHFGGHADPAVEGQLEAVEKAPDADLSVLGARLQESKAGDDEELLRAAGELLHAARPEGSVTIKNSQGVIVYNSGTSTMNFHFGG